MSWWLFLQLILLILLVGLVVGAVSQNFTDNLYKRRDENDKNQWGRDWHNDPETYNVKDYPES